VAKDNAAMERPFNPERGILPTERLKTPVAWYEIHMEESDYAKACLAALFDVQLSEPECSEVTMRCLPLRPALPGMTLSSEED